MQLHLLIKPAHICPPGNLNECYTLLNSGAWVNYVDRAGYLALHYACSAGSYEVVKLLLEFGADHSSFLTGRHM